MRKYPQNKTPVNSRANHLPEGWVVMDLGKLAEKIGSGITPTGGEKVYKIEGRPFLRSQNVGWGNLLLDDIAFIDESTHNSFRSTEIKENDVFLNITGASIGRSAVADSRVVNGNVNQHVCIIRTKTKELNPYFLNSFLLSQKGQNLIDSFQAGGNRQGLNFEQIKSFKVPVPPLPEQRAIASCLSTWDKAIAATTALIAQKQLRKKWLMQMLLTGKKRLKGFGEEKGFFKTDLGLKITIGWKIIQLNEIFNERNQRSNNQTEFPLFSLTIEKGLTDKTERYERSFLLKDKDNNQYKVVYPNDILFNPMNLRFGAIAKSNLQIKVSVSAYYNVIFQSKEGVNISFYDYLFKTDEFANLYDKIAIGSLNEKKRVHLSNFLKLQVPFPSFEEQTAIAAVLSAADKELQLLNEKLEKLKEQKKGLMQILLTGKKRLKL